MVSAGTPCSGAAIGHQAPARLHVAGSVPHVHGAFAASVLIEVNELATIEMARAPAFTTRLQNLPFGEGLEGMSVLVVDDQEDVRDLLTVVLRSHGVLVHTADTAGAALVKLNTVHVDLVTSDIGMPVEDGYSFIRAVRALPAADKAHVPALALTAFGQDEDRNRAQRAGFTAYMTKPADSAALVRAVADLGGRVAPLQALA
jgi:CheY-like chemotaxis protein